MQAVIEHLLCAELGMEISWILIYLKETWGALGAWQGAPGCRLGVQRENKGPL